MHGRYTCCICISSTQLECIRTQDLRHWVEFLPTPYVTFLIDTHQSHIAAFGKQKQVTNYWCSNFFLFVKQMLINCSFNFVADWSWDYAWSLEKADKQLLKVSTIVWGLQYQITHFFLLSLTSPSSPLFLTAVLFPSLVLPCPFFLPSPPLLFLFLLLLLLLFLPPLHPPPHLSLSFPSSSVVLYFVRPDEKAFWKQRGKEASKTSVFGLLTEKFVEVLISWNRRYDTWLLISTLPPKALVYIHLDIIHVRSALPGFPAFFSCSFIVNVN